MTRGGGKLPDGCPAPWAVVHGGTRQRPILRTPQRVFVRWNAMRSQSPFLNPNVTSRGVPDVSS